MLLPAVRQLRVSGRKEPSPWAVGTGSAELPQRAPLRRRRRAARAEAGPDVFEPKTKKWQQRPPRTATQPRARSLAAPSEVHEAAPAARARRAAAQVLRRKNAPRGLSLNKRIRHERDGARSALKSGPRARESHASCKRRSPARSFRRRTRPSGQQTCKSTLTSVGERRVGGKRTARARALVASALPVHAATRAAPPSSGGADLLSAAGTIARGQ